MEHLNLRLGCDLVFMPRMKDKLDNPKFINKVLTHNEQDLFKGIAHPRLRLEFLSGRFACKEAYAKALGCGIGEVDFLELEILRDAQGAPVCEKGQVSISHDGEYAMAVVIVS